MTGESDLTHRTFIEGRLARPSFLAADAVLAFRFNAPSGVVYIAAELDLYHRVDGVSVYFCTKRGDPANPIIAELGWISERVFLPVAN